MPLILRVFNNTIFESYIWPVFLVTNIHPRSTHQQTLASCEDSTSRKKPSYTPKNAPHALVTPNVLITESYAPFRVSVTIERDAAKAVDVFAFKPTAYSRSGQAGNPRSQHACYRTAPRRLLYTVAILYYHFSPSG